MRHILRNVYFVKFHQKTGKTNYTSNLCFSNKKAATKFASEACKHWKESEKDEDNFNYEIIQRKLLTDW